VTNGAIFAMIPSTGEILVYQGSKNFYARDIDGQVDVIQSLRQPGSTVKPFLYLMALESGANPDDLLLDIESEYNSFQEGSVYISENYSLKEYGLVRLKKAL
jgi:membrane carboxypeptidase/penicillin-binding protein PbpC